MTAKRSPATGPKIGPDCRQISRGSLGPIDGRTLQGKFARKLESELVNHVGGKPTFPQTLLIRRIVRGTWQLEQLDAKMASGRWTDHDSRTYGGLSNSLRLALRELGMKPAQSKPKSVADYITEIAREESVDEIPA
jgi:hypothetical protein